MFWLKPVRILQWCASQAHLVGLREDFKSLRQWEENSDKYLSVHLIIQCITMLLLREVKSRLFYFPFKEHFAKVILFSLLETGHGIRGKNPVQLYEKQTLLKLCIILLWLLVGPIQKKSSQWVLHVFLRFYTVYFVLHYVSGNWSWTGEEEQDSDSIHFVF